MSFNMDNLTNGHIEVYYDDDYDYDEYSWIYYN